MGIQFVKWVLLLLFYNMSIATSFQKNFKVDKNSIKHFYKLWVLKITELHTVRVNVKTAVYPSQPCFPQIKIS